MQLSIHNTTSRKRFAMRKKRTQEVAYTYSWTVIVDSAVKSAASSRRGENPCPEKYKYSRLSEAPWVCSLSQVSSAYVISLLFGCGGCGLFGSIGKSAEQINLTLTGCRPPPFGSSSQSYTAFASLSGPLRAAAVISG